METERRRRGQAPDRGVGAEYVVLGGGNADKVGNLPHNARLGNNGNAFEGVRLWRVRSIKSSARAERGHHERTGPCAEIIREIDKVAIGRDVLTNLGEAVSIGFRFGE